MTRKNILIIGTIVVALCSLSFVVFIITQINQNIPGNTPISYTNPTNVVTSNEDLRKKYDYALITSNDNIKLKNTINEELLINLDPKNWKNIQWSKEGSYVSALGETAAGVSNLFIYNLSTQKWTQATEFDEGVTSYNWIDNDTILFTSGGWLHRYKYSSENEIVKLYQIDGAIVSVSPNFTTILIKDSKNVFSILSVEGKLLFSLDKITVKDTNTNIPIVEAYFNKDAENMLLVGPSVTFYTWKIGSTEAKAMPLDKDDDQDIAGVKILCSQEVDLFKSYRIEEGEIKFANVDTFNQELNALNFKELNGGTSNFVKCTDDNDVTFSISTSDSNNWYVISGDQVQRLVILDGSKEVAVK